MDLQMHPRMMSASQCRQARAALQITQVELARAAGVSHPTVSALEHGDDTIRQPARLSLAIALAEMGVVFRDDGSVLVSPRGGPSNGIIERTEK